MKGALNRIILILACAFFIALPGMAQTFLLQPATVENEKGEFETKLLLKKNSAFRITWTQLDGSNLDLSGAGAKLIIGRSSNTYDVLEVAVSGSRGDFIPNSIGLGAGRYYARVTNSSFRTTSAIQEDQTNNSSSIKYSNEILLLVEASEAPPIISPRGSVTNPTPTFQWSSVSGVPAYMVIVSSTPFDIVEDESGNISIEGATIVWQYITTNTTAEYGAINTESSFTDEAPPLNSGQEYSYTVLNVYDESNVVYTSPVFGGIVPFIFSDPDAVPKTNLLSPIANETFFSEEIITFNWTKVSQASNYTINLLQIVKQQGIDVTVPIWSSTSTNSSIEYPAIENLKNGRYQWNVVTNNSTGGGTTSNSRFFDYKIETGEFGARIQSGSDNSSLLGVELTARAISGGVTPSIPFFIQSELHTDSLVAGVYEFTAEKTGYENASVQATIRDGRRTTFTIILNPLPSSLKGNVKDETGANVENASVLIKNLATGVTKKETTNINGEFSSSLKSGSYSLSVSKSGFISPAIREVTVGVNEQKELSSSFTLVNDQATVSGTVFNENAQPVQRATVTIRNGARSYETKTNGSGLYQFTVASGDWTLSVEKIGFIKPADRKISLSTGDVLQNQNFTIVGNANQVTGFVRERITNEDGTVGSAPFQGIEVRAVPNVGSTITTVTGRNGQYILSLKSGSYTIQATKTNYTSNQERELVIGIAIGETISGMDFELIPNPSSVSGTVTQPNGNGVSSATVSIPGVGTVVTNSSGFYKISVPTGSHSISVAKTGLVSPSPRSVNVNAGQNLTGINFEMTPNAGTISGKVTSGGEPLSNTSVTAINTTNAKKVSLISNLNGEYAFNIQSGSWYIKATKSGFISDSTNTLTIGPGQQLVNQNFVLTKNLTTVKGTITDGTNALRNATVSVTQTSGGTFSQSTFSQINGNYAFSLPAGNTYQITVSKDGFKTKSDITTQLIPEQTVTKNYQLSANPSSVAGTVFVSGQSVLTNAKIVAKNSNGIRVDSTVSKTNGTYLLGLSPGSYSLVMTKPGYTTQSKSTSLSIGQNITGLNFTTSENFVFFSGSVTDTEESGLEQAFINITRSSGAGASAVTDQDGGFTVTGLTGGSYSIQISKSGYVEKTIIRTVNDGDFITIDEQLTPKNGSISGIIRDQNGEVISEATVTARNDNGNEYTAVTTGVGNYTLSSLELGNYTVSASKTGYTSEGGTEASITEVNLNRTNVIVNNLVANNVTINGTVTNASTSNSIKDVEVSISGENGSGFSLSNASGLFAVSNLSSGTYQVISGKDGFRSDTTEITINPGSSSGTVNVSIRPNNGRISGQVTDPNGGSLPFRVTVLAVSDNQSLTTQTNDAGEFVFDGIETGLSYQISTDIYRDGYENVETTLQVQSGISEVSLDEDLKVGVRKSTISGNVGIADVTIKLLDSNTNEVLELGSSEEDGSYLFEFLRQGEYKVEPLRTGYTFTPGVSSVITLGIESSETVNFSVVSNIATLDVKVTNENGIGVSNVDVTIISADTTIILTKKTGQSGIARFSRIKATTFYVVRPVKEGFTADPESKDVTLASGDSTTTAFILTANSSTLSGVVKSVSGTTTGNLRDASVALIFNSTGQTFETSSNTSGEYLFESLAPGSYSIVASKTGFINDTLNIEIVAGQELIADDIILSTASVDLRGLVIFRDTGVEGVEVSAISTSTLKTKTNSSGSFRFASLPVKPGPADTTVYQVKVTQGVFSKSYLVTITPDLVGTRVNVPTTNLPSGKIELIVTDGVDPIPGAQVTFGISGGESTSEITGNDGAFSSSDNLRKASYLVSVAKEGYLYPQNTIRIELDSDTTILNRSVFLPYNQLQIEQILADEDTKVDVVNRDGYSNLFTTGSLFYKRKSESQFNRVSMAKVGDTLRAYIPAIGTVEEVTFYTSIQDINRSNTYLSEESSIIPLASGILTNIRVTPTINGQSLRAGETYQLDLFVRDGINKSLEDRFNGDNPSGTVTWTILGGETGIVLSNQEETSITLEAIEEGTYQIQVSANLEGSVIDQTVELQVVDVPLEEIIVGIPSKQVANSTSALFSYSAVDTSGGSIVLGESLQWEVIPSAAGSIDGRGVFLASSASIIGSFQVKVTDQLTGISGISEVVELTARIEPGQAYVLQDGNGLELSVEEGSVDIPSQLSLGRTTPPETKKFVFAQGTNTSYTVGDQIITLSFNGSDLKKPAQLTLPEDSTLGLSTGTREIARFNFITLQWEILPSTAKLINSKPAGSVTIEQLGQFAVLAENEPLGIKYGAVLPSPFSPDIAPVKIGYWLDTAFPPAKVNIHIYNIRGELVRTILEDDLQQPGRYGSSSSTKEITWDGLTDNGTIARNGRYIIQIKAKDQQGEETKLLQVVLIK